MRTKLFNTQFADHGLVLANKTVAYSDIGAITHCNRRKIVNLVPSLETFCILIKQLSGGSSLLFVQVKLRRYAGAGGLRTGFKIPPEVEAQLTNLRYEYLATIDVLRQRSGVVPTTGGLFFAFKAEVMALFKKTNAAAAQHQV